MTGLPSIITSVSLFPRVLATTSVFPDALGVGVSRSAMMMSLFPSIFAVTAMIFPPRVRRIIKIHHRELREMYLILVSSGVFLHIPSASSSGSSVIYLGLFPKYLRTQRLVLPFFSQRALWFHFLSFIYVNGKSMGLKVRHGLVERFKRRGINHDNAGCHVAVDKLHNVAEMIRTCLG